MASLFHSLPFVLLAWLLPSAAPAAVYDPSQWTISLDHGKSATSALPATAIRQNDSICDAGSAQWSGIIPVDERRSMFYWYFESREAPETAPLVIWLNGGPGASSMLGAFQEIGPCTVTKDGQGTTRNDLSWTTFANMLFIDQPVGVGFSGAADPDLWAANLLEAGTDFDKFLDVFLRDLFPGLQGRPLHLAGESFGGKYCPVYASMIRRKFDSVILVNALVSLPSTVLGLYEHFCAPATTAGGDAANPPGHLNATACAAMEAAYSTCETLGRLCESTYDEVTCRLAWEKCMSVYEVFQREVVPGGRNPYDDRTTCTEPPMCGHLGMEEVTEYFNSERLQRALGFKKKLEFAVVNMEFNARWSNQTDTLLPSTREIVTLLDTKRTPILVMNGNNDAAVSTEGVTRTYDSLLWSGHAKFQVQKFKPWYYRGADGTRAQGGEFKSVGKLTLVTIDEAGHMSPHDQPLAVSGLVRAWTRHGAGFLNEADVVESRGLGETVRPDAA